MSPLEVLKQVIFPSSLDQSRARHFQLFVLFHHISLVTSQCPWLVSFFCSHVLDEKAQGLGPLSLPTLLPLVVGLLQSFGFSCYLYPMTLKFVFDCLQGILTYIFIFFLGLHLRHMQVPRLGVELELQLPVYTMATATWDLNCICDLCCSLQQCRILKTLSEARDRILILMDTMSGS